MAAARFDIAKAPAAKPSIPLGLMISRSGPYQMIGGELLKGAMMAIAEINDDEQFDFRFAAHLRDPRGVVAAYGEACSQLIRDEGVDHIVGCYTSASRKQVLPIVEQMNRLLWHPARYEGFESSDNVIYVGAAPNHTLIPLVQHMISKISSNVFCVGSNYVWTWENNRVMREIVAGAGGKVIAERLLELGDIATAHIVDEIMTVRPPVIFNTLVGASSYHFIRALHEAMIRDRIKIPMVSCSLCEPELKLIGADASIGCISSSAYFADIENVENRAFVRRWKARYGLASVPSVDSVSVYVSIMLLARAILRAGTSAVDAVAKAAANQRYESPQGPVWIDPDNNHCFLTSRLARSAPGYRFKVFWEGDAPERPDPYLARLDLAAVGAAAVAGNKGAARLPNHLRIVK